MTDKQQMIDNCKNKLILLMAEIGDCQETYKEELAVVAKEYPLNQAIFCISNALLAIRKKEENMFYTITKNGVEINRVPSMRHASTEITAVINELPEGTPMCRNGLELIIGNTPETEITYKIVAPC